MSSTPSYRANAVWAGIFFVVATAFLFVGQALYQQALTGPDVLTGAADAQTRIALGVLVEYACVLAIPLIAVALYPVLRRVSAALAIGYVAFRLLEAAIFYQQEADRLFVLGLSREYVAAPTADRDQIDLLIRTLNGGEAWSGISSSLYNLVFVIGMLMLNWMLWTSRLVPRLIAGWGLVSAVVLGGVAVAVLFVELPDVLAITLIAPLAVQEMALALWFIVKGLDGDALARLEPPAGERPRPRASSTSPA